MKTLPQLLFALSCFTAIAQASDSIPEAKSRFYEPARFGDYEVHYSAFNSTFIPPDIAEQYNLERGHRFGMVNIAIRNVKHSETGKAVKGNIKGSKINLLTQTNSLEFKEIRETDAVYYLAGFRFSDQELLKFTIDITPEGSPQTETIRFEQVFYQEE